MSKEIIEAFDKKFVKNENGFWCVQRYDIEEYHNFILEILQSQKEKIIKIGEGMRELKPKDIVSEKEIENNPELLLVMKIIRKQWLIKEETISDYQKKIREV